MTCRKVVRPSVAGILRRNPYWENGVFNWSLNNDTCEISLPIRLLLPVINQDFRTSSFAVTRLATNL